MNRVVLFLSVLTALVTWSAAPLWGQDLDRPADKTVATEKKLNSSGPDLSTKARMQPLSKTVKGMKSQSGFFTLYKNKDKLYALIPKKLMGKPFFLAMTISRGIYAGMQWDDMLVYWTRRDDKLLLVRPEVRYQAGKTTLANIVSKTYPAVIIRALPIMSQTSGGDCLINLAHLFKTDLAGVSRMAPSLLGVQGRLNPGLSRWAQVKVFPKNVDVEVDLAFTGIKVRGASSFTDSSDRKRSHRMGVYFSMSYLPQTNYRPRRTDIRVGYFNTARKDFTRPHKDRTRFRRYIHRWHLEKIDPSLKVSPPKNPIIFYIEKTVPYRYRQYVRDGILEWNKAFEKIGFTGAIVVRQQTKTEFADLDPADVRYNFFRWATNEMGFAAGPSRVNPLTGQILDADIIFDDAMLRYIAGEYNLMAPSAHMWMGDEKMAYLYKNIPGLGQSKKKSYPWDKKTPSRITAFHRVLKVMNQKGRPTCLHSCGMRHQFFMASMALKAKGVKKVPEEVIGQYVKDIVMHEVGHTLGLYHNFKASTIYSLKEINSEKKPKAIAGSVMDYNASNFVPKGETQGHYFPQTIGPYDYWAIEYGYRMIPQSKEDKTLQKIAQRAGEKKLVYANDLFASLADADPHITRWDMGDDMVAYAKSRHKLVDQLMKNIVKTQVDKGEYYFPIRQAMASLLGDYAYSSYLAARYIGGAHLAWTHKGDPKSNPPLKVVKGKKQREALEFLTQTLFSEKGIEIPREVLAHLAPGIRWHWDSDELTPRAIYPIHEVKLRIQERTLGILLNPMNLWRLHNLPLQVKKGEDTFTITELFDGLTKAMWSELDKAPKKGVPYISSQRRNLQRKYLQLWIQYFALDRGTQAIPEDAKTIARANLRDLRDKIGKAMALKDLDRTNKAHLEECYHRIEQVLKANYIR